MAKSRPAASPLDQVRAMLTAAEQQVVNSSLGATIAKATREQVEAATKRARTLRDKWRDLHAAQTRTTKRSAKAGTAVNERTRAKHDVFDGAVRRLEARLAEFAAGVSAVVGTRAGRLKSAGNPSKAARTKAARESRAGVRSRLKEAVADLNRPAKAAKPAKAVAAAKPAAAAAAAKPSVSAARRVAGKKRTAKAAPAAAVAQPKVPFSAAKQRSAKASAKAARLTLKGITTRRGGHVLASTKRSQARRDGRSR